MLVGDEAEDTSVIFSRSICPSTANLYEVDICEGLKFKYTSLLMKSYMFKVCMRVYLGENIFFGVVSSLELFPAASFKSRDPLNAS